MFTHFVQHKGNIQGISNEQLFQQKCNHHTDRPDNMIILLDTDFNSSICLLEINYVTC